MNELIYKTEIQSQILKTNLWLPGDKGGVLNWEIGIDIYTIYCIHYTYILLYIKQLTNKDLLNSTGNSTQYSVMTYNGKELIKERIYVYV